MRPPPDDVDPGLMGVLDLLLETRSVTRTAELLGVSQPTVSRSLARLRKRLSDPLLVKGGGGMVLTARAEGLREPLKAWLAQGRSILAPDSFCPAEAARDFRIASTDFGVLRVVRPKLRRLAGEAPRCTLSVEPLNAASPRRLASADLDVVVTGFEPTGGLYARRLFTETLACVVRAEHPLLGDGKAPPLETLVEWPRLLVRIAEIEVDRLGDALRERGLRPRSTLRAEGFTLAPHLVADSDAIATLPASAARELARTHGLALLPLPIDLGSFDYWLVWHERSRRDAGVSWLLDLLADGFSPLPRGA